MTDNKLSRRELAAAVAGALPATAQTAAEDLDAAAREQVQRNREAIGKVEVPIMLEPSFVFRP